MHIVWGPGSEHPGSFPGPLVTPLHATRSISICHSFPSLDFSFVVHTSPHLKVYLAAFHVTAQKPSKISSVQLGNLHLLHLVYF
jgi:hypothetical protein